MYIIITTIINDRRLPESGSNNGLHLQSQRHSHHDIDIFTRSCFFRVPMEASKYHSTYVQ